MSFTRHQRDGYMLLEIVPTLMVVAVLMTIVIVATNPVKNFQEARNEKRRNDVAKIADAIEAYTRDVDRRLLMRIPQSTPKEICADVKTGSCTNLFNVNELIGTYLDAVPIDPRAEDADRFVDHSRYFVQRNTDNRVTVSAPDTEPVGSTDISVTR